MLILKAILLLLLFRYQPRIKEKVRSLDCLRTSFYLTSSKLNRNLHPALELHPEFLLVHHNHHIHQSEPEVFGEFSEQIFKSAHLINEPLYHQRPSPTLCKLVLQLFLLGLSVPVFLSKLSIPSIGKLLFCDSVL